MARKAAELGPLKLLRTSAERVAAVADIDLDAMGVAQIIVVRSGVYLGSPLRGCRDLLKFNGGEILPQARCCPGLRGFAQAAVGYIQDSCGERSPEPRPFRGGFRCRDPVAGCHDLP